MYMSPPGLPYIEPDIFVNGSRLEAVDTLVYLDSGTQGMYSLDAEANYRIEQASQALGKT